MDAYAFFSFVPSVFIDQFRTEKSCDYCKWLAVFVCHMSAKYIDCLNLFAALMACVEYEAAFYNRTRFAARCT